MSRYAQFFAHHPRIVFAWVVIATVLAVVGVARLDFDDSPRGIIRSDDESYLELLRVQEQFGADDNDFVVVLERDGWFDAEGVEILRRVEREARAIDGVERVYGIASIVEVRGLLPRPLLPDVEASAREYADARARAMAHPFVGGVLLSEDERVALVTARLAGGDLRVEELRPALDAMRALCGTLETEHGIEAAVTGIPAFRAVIFDTIRRDQVMFTALGALVCFLVALGIFRSWRACLVVTTPAVLGALWVTGALGLVGSRIDLMGSVLPVLCILIAFTDSVHLTLDVQAERAHGHDLREAIRHAIQKLGMPCFLTSITTAIGLGSLTFSGLPVIRNFGQQAFFSVLVVFTAVMTTLPLAALFLAPPARPLPGESGWFARLFRRITRAPRAISALGIVATVGLLAMCSTLVPENKLTESMPHDDEVYTAFRRCEAAFGGILPIYVLVEWPEESGPDDPRWHSAMAGAERLLAAEERLSRPISPLGLFALVPGDGAGALAVLPEELTSTLLLPDLRRAVAISRISDLGTVELVPVLGSIESGIDELGAQHPGFEFTLTGTDVVARRTVNRMISDLAGGLGVAALLIFGVIALEFRSLRLGLMSLLPNIFPLAFVGAVLAVTGRPLQVASAILFTVLLGIAVDDTIHMLARFRHERRGGADRPTAAGRAGAAVGAAIMTTSLILVAGYSVVFASSVPTNRLFAALLCVGLAAALIGDLVLLPAMLSLGKKRRAGEL